MESPTALLDALREARWDVAFRVYGNSHATLIGLLVDWWISARPGLRWALEGGPSHSYTPRGIGGGICDAILGEGESSLGVVEVEGTRLKSTIEKMGKFLTSTLTDLQTLTFGIFLAYAYEPVGRGEVRTIAPLPLNTLVEHAITATRGVPDKQVAILTLDKQWSRVRSGPRARNEYYMGTPALVRGALISNGDLVVGDDLIARAPET